MYPGIFYMKWGSEGSVLDFLFDGHLMIFIDKVMVMSGNL